MDMLITLLFADWSPYDGIVSLLVRHLRDWVEAREGRVLTVACLESNCTRIRDFYTINRLLIVRVSAYLHASIVLVHLNRLFLLGAANYLSEGHPPSGNSKRDEIGPQTV
jgi:hypothetical protein